MTINDQGISRLSDKVSALKLMDYNPFDSRKSLSVKGFREEIFWNHFFVKTQALGDSVHALNERISKHTYTHQPNLIYLTGYSGNGKTTFINHFIKEHLDLSEFHDVYENLIGEHVPYDFSQMPTDVESVEYKVEAFDLIIKKALETAIYNSDFTSFIANDGILKSFIPNMEIRALLLSILANNQEKIQLEAIHACINDLTYLDRLTLYLVYQIYLTKHRAKNSLFVCLDNLDELPYAYLSNEFNIHIERVLRNVQTFCLHPSVQFDFESNFFLILVIRKVNLCYLNWHIYDQSIKHTHKAKIDLDESGRKIIKQRAKMIRTLNHDEHHGIFVDLVDIIGDDPITSSLYLPLFNFDIRDLSIAMLDIARKVYDSNGAIPRLRPKNFDSFKRNKAIRGGRGILINGLIHSIYQKEIFDEIREVDEQFGHCKPSRMILTVLCNKTFNYSSGNSIEDNSEVKPIDLFELWESVRHLFSVNTLLSWLKMFVELNLSKWSHLISVFGKEYTIVSIDEVTHYSIKWDEEAKLLHEADDLSKFIDLYDPPQDIMARWEEIKSILSNVTIELNHSGYVFLRSICTHFEFYAASSIPDLPPLFQATYLDANNQFVFIKIIGRVLERVKGCTQAMFNYMSSQMKKNGFENLSDAQKWAAQKNMPFLFKEPSATKGKIITYFSDFYFIRVIFMHVEYLDCFRHYLLTSDQFHSYHQQIYELRTKLSLVEIDLYLVRKIHEYLQIARNKKYINLISTHRRGLLDKFFFRAEEIIHNSEQAGTWRPICFLPS